MNTSTSTPVFAKPVLCEYQPLQGFYDLRNWDIPKKDFLKLWNIQKYLFQCEQNRQKGLYKNMPNELEKVKNLSAVVNWFQNFVSLWSETVC